MLFSRLGFIRFFAMAFLTFFRTISVKIALRIERGPEPPEVLEALRTSVGLDVLNACGVPPALVVSSTSTGAREGWRRFVLSSCSGLAALVTDELGAKLAKTTISFDELYGQDLVGRATALGRLVQQANMPLPDARKVVGL